MLQATENLTNPRTHSKVINVAKMVTSKPQMAVQNIIKELDIKS
jgi:hypothetical protein